MDKFTELNWQLFKYFFMKGVLLFISILISSFIIAQQPSGFPMTNSTGYIKYGWIQNDSGYIAAKRDTTINPKYAGTTIYWQHNGVDSALWIYNGRTTGKKWDKILYGAIIFPASTAWDLSGNTGTIPGTSFIGTIDNAGLMFKTNNVQSGYIDLTGLYGTSFGYQSLQSNLNYYNSAFGYQALKSTTTGGGNTGFGYQTLSSNTIGVGNVAAGSQALHSNVSGDYNIGIGYFALGNNVNGANNISIGQSSSGNTNASNNSVYGWRSLFSNTNGTNNIALGYMSGYYNTSLSNRLYVSSLDNISGMGDTTKAIIYGYQDAVTASQRLSLNSKLILPYLATGIPSGAKRILIGSDNQIYAADTTAGGGGATPTLQQVITAGNTLTKTDTIIMGNKDLLFSNTSGTVKVTEDIWTGIGVNNGIKSNGGVTGIGDNFVNNHGNFFKVDDDNSKAYYDNTAHTGNVGINNTSPAYPLDVTGNFNLTGNIYKSGVKWLHNTGDANGSVFLGNSIGGSNAGIYNLGIGAYTMGGNTTGTFNIAIGTSALNAMTNGTSNTAIGFGAMKDAVNSDGTVQNYVAIGTDALKNVRSGYSNIAVGKLCLNNFDSGIGNAVLGASVNVYRGAFNSGVGSDVLSNRLFEGSYNSWVGGYAMNIKKSGSYNSVLGNHTLTSDTIGSNNTALGSYALTALNGSNNIGIGYFAGAYSTGSNKIFLGSLDQGTAAKDTTGTAMYVEQNSTASLQRMRFNGQVRLPNLTYNKAIYALYRNANGDISYGDTTSSGGGSSTIGRFTDSVISPIHLMRYDASYPQYIKSYDVNNLEVAGPIVWLHATHPGGYVINQSAGGILYLNAAGQIGNGFAIDASAALQIDGTNKGFLPPRMTTTQKNAISSPAEGLVVYDLTLHKLCYYNGSAWTCF